MPKHFRGGSNSGVSRPLTTDDVEIAANALLLGGPVELGNAREVADLLTDLRHRVKLAAAADEPPPHVDLAEVTVRKTGLFLAGNKGIPRARMPQLSGVPTPGSPAASLPRDDKGRANILPLFIQHVQAMGVQVQTGGQAVPTAFHPTQREIDALRVAHILKKLKAAERPQADWEPEPEPPKPIVVGQELFILDGHHHWAAHAVWEFSKKGHLRLTIPFDLIDMPICALLLKANRFATAQGIPHAQMFNSTPSTAGPAVQPARNVSSLS